MKYSNQGQRTLKRAKNFRVRPFLNVMDLELLVYQNVTDLNTKVDKPYYSIAAVVDECDIIVMTKTWLKECVRDGEIFPESYSVIQVDRNFNLTNRTWEGSPYRC